MMNPTESPRIFMTAADTQRLNKGKVDIGNGSTQWVVLLILVMDSTGNMVI